MSRYTPLRGREPVKKTPGAKKAGARKSGKRGKPPAASFAKPKKFVKPGAFVCNECKKAFRTEEALVIHARDAHDKPIDPASMTPLKPSMVRCTLCGAPVRKRNLEQHLRFVHELV